MGAELGIVGAGLFVGLVLVALFRRIPDNPTWWTVRALALFMLVNSLISGDIYGDRLLWGLLVILLAASSGDNLLQPAEGSSTRLPIGMGSARTR